MLIYAEYRGIEDINTITATYNEITLENFKQMKFYQITLKEV